MSIKCDFCKRELVKAEELRRSPSGFAFMCGKCLAQIQNRTTQPRPQVPKPSNN